MTPYTLVPINLISAWFAYDRGKRKGEGGKALLLGLVLGPIGVLIASVSSGKFCPHCHQAPHDKGWAECPVVSSKMSEITADIRENPRRVKRLLVIACAALIAVSLLAWFLIRNLEGISGV